mgnify:FL=1
MSVSEKPKVALVLGDPNGIGPELAAKLVAEQETSEKAHVVILADKKVLDEGIRIAGVDLNYKATERVSAEMMTGATPVLLTRPVCVGDDSQRGRV